MIYAIHLLGHEKMSQRFTKKKFKVLEFKIL